MLWSHRRKGLAEILISTNMLISIVQVTSISTSVTPTMHVDSENDIQG